MSLKLVLGIIAAAFICAVSKASLLTCAGVAGLIFICVLCGVGEKG
jgi:hypothetical protein